MSATLEIRSRRTFLGPNLELEEQAVVLAIETIGEMDLAKLWQEIVRELPGLRKADAPKTFGELFGRTVIELEQLGMSLFVSRWRARTEGNLHIVAVQYIDPETGERAVDCASDWIRDILAGRPFPFSSRFRDLERGFVRSRFGGPTIYSILEAGHREGIPMFYIPSEDVFQWGQGRKQLRGRSTVLHRDSIKDTELTTYKDLAKSFLEDLGFPVPAGRLCFSLDEAEEAAREIGFPVVTKPVDGHKGQGVTTNITSDIELRMGFEIARESAKGPHDPVIVEKHVSGTDHRLLTINGKFVAALQRIPAHVIGDGMHSIEELIESENSRPERADTPRSALGKIKIDEDLVGFLKERDLSLRDVPPEGECVVLRRVANLSAGGVSVNVTERIHPMNVKLAEDVARFLDVHILGIDLLAEDISKPWSESPCAIIEINAGPGVFMHLVPARGESIDVPGKIMQAFFPAPEAARIPTLVFNRLGEELARALTGMCLSRSGVEEVGVARVEGVAFNDEFFSARPRHLSNIRNVMRNPRVDVALLEYNEAVIREEGLYHWGADLVVLDSPSAAERVLARDLLPHAAVIEMDRGAGTIVAKRDGKEKRLAVSQGDIDRALVETIEPFLAELIRRYARS